MFRRLRIAVLLYVLLFAAAAQYFAARRSTDWDDSLWIDVYAITGDGSRETRNYVDHLGAGEFKGIEDFLATEAHRYGVALERPFRLNFKGEFRDPLPELQSSAGLLGTLWWSLRMRWLAARLRWRSSGPSGDVLVFAVFHEPSAYLALDRSTALRKGLIAVANVFADADARGANQMVLAHELLHTLGATDKYSAGTNLPRFPEGYAAPTAEPLLPQKKAELMAGRIPISSTSAEIPASLREVVVGPATAIEIGWPQP